MFYFTVTEAPAQQFIAPKVSTLQSRADKEPELKIKRVRERDAREAQGRREKGMMRFETYQKEKNINSLREAIKHFESAGSGEKRESVCVGVG